MPFKMFNASSSNHSQPPPLPDLAKREWLKFDSPLGRVAGVFDHVFGLPIPVINWLTRDADDSLMKVAMNVLLPCLAFSKISGNEAIRQPENVPPPVVGFFSIAIGMAIGWMVRRYATETGPARHAPTPSRLACSTLVLYPSRSANRCLAKMP